MPHGRGGRKGLTAAQRSSSPTPTENILNMSLPADLRNLSVQEVLAQQSLPSSGGGGSSSIITSSGKVTSISFKIPKGSSRVNIRRIRELAFRKARRRTGRKILLSQKTKKILKKPLKKGQKLRDITSLGLTRELREREQLNKKIEDFNKDIETFSNKFGGKELIEKNFALAKKQEKQLDKRRADIDKSEKGFKKSIPTRVSESIESKRESLRAEKQQIIKEKGFKSVFDPRIKRINRNLESLGAVAPVISTGIALVTLPKTIKSIITDPSQLKKVPSNIGKGLTKFGKIAVLTPSEAIAVIGTEAFLLKGTGKTLKIVGKISAKNIARISGKLKKIEGGKVKIGKGLTIEIVKPGLGKILEPLSKQAKLAGRRLPMVTSAQADRLVNLVRTKRVVRKPIPNEKILSIKTKKLLRKFDRGRITKRQIRILDSRIRTEAGESLLDRSFFVDPKGRARVSRLGIQREASLSDIFTGNFVFKTQKPQILFFENIKVQQFPKGLKNIKNKLKTGKTLTKSEANKLLQFQLKTSGKFKPIGALTREPELTLAPGEIIKKVKTLAKVEINGRLVPIVKVKVIKAKPKTRNLISKARKGKITAKEIKVLRRNLRKETGFKTSLSRRISRKPRVSLRRISLTGLSRIVRRGKRAGPRPRPRPGRPRGRPTPKRPPTRPPGRPRRPVVRPRPRPTPKPRPRPGRVGKPPIAPRAPPLIPIKIRLRKKRKGRKRPKKLQAWDVFSRPIKKFKGQKQPKLIKLNKRPLTKIQAERLGSTLADTTIARTFKIKASRGKPQRPRLKTKRFQKRKFRSFRIKKGKKIGLKNTFIEKRKFLIDSRGEKKGLTLRRGLAKLRRESRVKPIKRKRIITPNQRSKLLKNLKKARAVRNKNLKKKK